MNQINLPQFAGRTTPSSPPVRPVTPSSEEIAVAINRLLTRRDVATQLGVSMQTLAKWHRESRGPICILLARHLARYRAEDVLAYLDDLRTAPPTSE